MRRLLMLLLLVGCGDDAARPDAAIDARPDTPTAPAIDWSIWGQPCTRPSYGMQSCLASDGVTGGICVLTGDPCTQGNCPGMCVHYCFTQPSYSTECPPDAMRTENPVTSDGCWCKQL